MRTLWMVLAFILIIPGAAHAEDDYYKSKVVWKDSAKLEQNVNVLSVRKLTNNKLDMMSTTYKLTKKLFFIYWKIDVSKCYEDALDIRVVRSHHDLNSRKFFPRVDKYADEPGQGTEIISGRYFRNTNKIYIVPINNSKYYWRKDFSHEVLHYLFDDCNIRFKNNDEEHVLISEFLNKYEVEFN